MAKLCVLQIVGEVPPDWTPPVPQPPLGTWGGSGQPFPTPPIYMPAPPLGTWGGSGQPFPGYGLPGPQPGGPRPEHPIYYPIGIWGGAGEPFPGWGLPPEGAPPKPDEPPKDEDGQWRWVPPYGWVWDPGTDDVQPHK